MARRLLCDPPHAGPSKGCVRGFSHQRVEFGNSLDLARTIRGIIATGRSRLRGTPLAVVSVVVVSLVVVSVVSTVRHAECGIGLRPRDRNGNRGSGRSREVGRNRDSLSRSESPPPRTWLAAIRARPRPGLRSQHGRCEGSATALRSPRSTAVAVLFSILLFGGILGLALEVPAEEQGAGGGRALVAETPLSPEAAAAVQSVLRTLRSRPPAAGQPIAALALEVSRSPDLVLDALAETRSGTSARATEALTAHSRRIAELREAIAASTGSTDGGRAAELQAAPYLDELTAALNRAGDEKDQDRRAAELKALLQRIQSGEIPIRQPYADARAPTFLWFQGTSDSEGDEKNALTSGKETEHAGSAGE